MQWHNRLRVLGRRIGLTESLMSKLGPIPSKPFETLPDIYDTYTPLLAKVLLVKEGALRFPKPPSPYYGDKPDLPYNWNVHVGPNWVAGFSLSPLPGCCGVVISHGAGVDPRYQGKGVGTLMNAMRVDIARLYGYGTMLCTDLVTNTPQRRILARNGWKDVHTFTNPRTDNELAISVIDLQGRKG